MTDEAKSVPKQSMFADGSFITLMFVIVMIIGIWSYINELHGHIDDLNAENDALLIRSIEQGRLISNMNMYLELQPYLSDGLIIPKKNKYL